MDITLVDIYETRDPFALLDGQDAELGHVAATIFDAGDGELDPDLDEQLEPAGSRILILHSVRLLPQWRGFGLGALLAGTAIRKLSGGARAAVCYPAPLSEQAEAGPEDQGDTEWDQAVAALRQVWARLGFAHFRDGVHVLDLSLVTLDEKLGQLRKDAERYRAARS
jgi:GNAT superfamily N-acetyltransferase